MVSNNFQNPTDFLIINSALERCHTTAYFITKYDHSLWMLSLFTKSGNATGHSPPYVVGLPPRTEKQSIGSTGIWSIVCYYTSLALGET